MEQEGKRNETMNIGKWDHPALIAKNNFKYKSLSDWSLNIAVGCNHACRFCYVPSVSTNKLAGSLAELGVKDPDAEWGDYVFLRSWDEKAFLASLKKAEETPLDQLSRDGNRAVMLCTTTDPYQVAADPEWNMRRSELVRNCLEAILEHSTLNVRILTRSPLARGDFDLFKRFGNRLLFGMSLPTLDPILAKVYEPKAPAPRRRLETLKLAKDEGIPIYVAMAPTYPESKWKDLHETLHFIKQLDPLTIFHEPINIRAENVQRISEQGAKAGVQLNTSVFSTRFSWADYACKQLHQVESIADDLGIGHKLHLWPDASLGNALISEASTAWLSHWWNRISEWPGKEGKA